MSFPLEVGVALLGLPKNMGLNVDKKQGKLEQLNFFFK